MDSSNSAVSTKTRRLDGRMGGGTLRPLSCELSCLHRADGSALWKSGGGTGNTSSYSSSTTAVMAAVYGPVAPKHARHEHPTCAIVSVILKGTATQQTTTTSSSNINSISSFTAEWQDLLTQWLTNAIVVQEYPRSVIQIVLQVIQADGSVLSAALHAAVAALLDAGIAMQYLPVATTINCGYHQYHHRRHVSNSKDSTNIENKNKELSTSSDGLDKEDNDDGERRVLALLLDPTADEEMEEDSLTLVIVTDPRQQQQQQPLGDASTSSAILGSCIIRMGSSSCDTVDSSKGRRRRCRRPCGLSLDTLQPCIHLAHKASPAVMAFWRLAVEQKCQREAQTLWSSSSLPS